MTVPNALSVSRIPLAAVLMAAIFTEWWWIGIIAFYLAVASDLFDGFIARRNNQTSSMGTKLDHSSDALFVFCGLAALGATSVITLYLCVVQITSFVLYLAEAIAPKSVLRPSALGKANGVAYFIVIGIPVTQNALGLAWIGDQPLHIVAWLLVVTSLVSIVQRYFTRMRSG